MWTVLNWDGNSPAQLWAGARALGRSGQSGQLLARTARPTKLYVTTAGNLIVEQSSPPRGG